MKRCPTCQRTYTDDTLRFCLEDGTTLFRESASDMEKTLLLDPSPSGEEPPPTEILDYSVPPTVLAQEENATVQRKKPTPTVRQQGRPTLHESPNAAAIPAIQPKPRSTASIVAITAIATVLLLSIGGLGAWLVLRDKNNSNAGNESPRSGNNSANISSSNNADLPSKNGNTTKGGGSPTPTATPAKSPASSPTPTPTPPANDPAIVRKEVTQALNGWAQTMGSLDAHMAYYANTLHTYYLQSNVSLARVRAIIAPAFTKYKTFDVKLTNMQIEVDPSGNSAVATFDKTFTFGGDSTYSGSGLNRFWLEKINGRWLITGEKDLKTYSVNK